MPALLGAVLVAADHVDARELPARVDVRRLLAARDDVCLPVVEDGVGEPSHRALELRRDGAGALARVDHDSIGVSAPAPTRSRSSWMPRDGVVPGRQRGDRAGRHLQPGGGDRGGDEDRGADGEEAHAAAA